MSDPIQAFREGRSAAKPTRAREATIAKLERIVEFKKVGDCWEWQRVRNQGYGVIYFEGRSLKAHRFIYELVKGLVPLHLVLDHMCENKLCVNPAHLQVLSNKANILKGNGASAINSRRTHCLNGHAFTPENTGAVSNQQPGRYCIACSRERARVQGKKPSYKARKIINNRNYQAMLTARRRAKATELRGTDVTE